MPYGLLPKINNKEAGPATGTIRHYPPSPDLGVQAGGNKTARNALSLVKFGDDRGFTGKKRIVYR